MKMKNNNPDVVLKEFLKIEMPWIYIMKSIDMNECSEGDFKSVIEIYLKWKLYFLRGKCKNADVEEWRKKIKQEYKGLIDVDTGKLAREIYWELWGWKCEKSKSFAELNNKYFSCCLGGDTMNSVQNILNALTEYMFDDGGYSIKKEQKASIRFLCSLVLPSPDCNGDANEFIEDLESIKGLQKYMETYHTLGNLVLVPKGFNRARAQRTDDFWDFSLQVLKKEYFKFKEEFTRYINYFYLWDYVTREKDNDVYVYSIKSLEQDNSNLKKAQYKKRLEKKRISKEDAEQFFETACEYIERRGRFMTFILRLKKSESEEVREISEEFLSSIQKDKFLKECYEDGYEAALGELDKLLGKNNQDGQIQSAVTEINNLREKCGFPKNTN